MILKNGSHYPTEAEALADLLTVAVNSAMVIAYWNIGKQIYEACGENERVAFRIKLDSLSKPYARRR